MTRGPARRTIRRLRPRTLGQALVETALAAPFLVMLLLGGAQVGSIAYDQVSLDTAAREGARAGAAAPNHTVISYGTNTTWYTAGNAATYTYTCQTADFATGGNPVCVAVANSSGFLTSSVFTSNPCGTNQGCVTIKVVPPASLASARNGPPALRLASAPLAGPDATNSVASPCNSGNQAEVDGSVNFGNVSGFSTATLADTTNDPSPTVSSSSPTFQYCVSANNNVSTETITAQVGPVGCGGYTGSITINDVTHGQLFSGENINVTYEGNCTTATTSTTSSSSTTTSTSSTTTTSTGVTSTVTGPAVGCASHPVDDSYYLTVTVTYPAPIFIPFINNLFQTSSGIRMITSSVTFPVDPCTMTGNGTE